MSQTQRQKLEFVAYQSAHFDACMALFEQNCPSHFAVNERQDFAEFLQQCPADYYVLIRQQQVVACFGFTVHPHDRHGQINWIMAAKSTHGSGIGRQMMQYAINLAKQAQIDIVDIAASHLSAPFFARFGAEALNYIEHGWGQDMHRIDMQLHISSGP